MDGVPLFCVLCLALHVTSSFHKPVTQIVFHSQHFFQQPEARDKPQPEQPEGQSQECKQGAHTDRGWRRC